MGKIVSKECANACNAADDLERICRDLARMCNNPTDAHYWRNRAMAAREMSAALGDVAIFGVNNLSKDKVI